MTTADSPASLKKLGAAGWIRRTSNAAEEVAAGRPGSGPPKLSELLFVRAVRRYIEALP
jgi:hypothetical protein